MHKFSATAAAFAAAAVAASALVGTSAQATPHPPAAASADRSQNHVQVLHLTSKIGDDTDIDLGAPGLSAGNQQVFRDKLFQGTARIGTSVGVAEIVALTETQLTAQIVGTAILPGGTLTLQAAFTEVLADGPPAVLHLAVTGGTGTFRDARGECQSRTAANSDDSTITCTIIHSR